MSEQDIYKVKELADKIKFNTATKDEYNEYYNLLVSNGITKEMINDALSKGNINSMTELFVARKKYSLQRKKDIDRFVIPSIVGIGLGLLLYFMIKGKK